MSKLSEDPWSATTALLDRRIVANWIDLACMQHPLYAPPAAQLNLSTLFRPPPSTARNGDFMSPEKFRAIKESGLI
jgi:hypothetical protein